MGLAAADSPSLISTHTGPFLSRPSRLARTWLAGLQAVFTQGTCFALRGPALTGSLSFFAAW